MLSLGVPYYGFSITYPPKLQNPILTIKAPTLTTLVEVFGILEAPVMAVSRVSKYPYSTVYTCIHRCLPGLGLAV